MKAYDNNAQFDKFLHNSALIIHYMLLSLASKADYLTGKGSIT
jgi:hypothetical protein